MKYTIHIFLLLILVLHVSCSGEKTQIVEEDQTIALTPPYEINLEEAVKKVTSEQLSTIGSEIQYIPLETSASSLIRKVHNYLFFNNTVLVGDFNNLYQFDKEGKFIQKIGNKGHGPADYTYITTLIKNNEAGSFYLFTTGKINVYNDKAKFSKSIPLKDRELRGYAGVSTSTDELLIYLGSIFKPVGDTTTVYSLAKLDTLGNVIEKTPHDSPLPSPHNGIIIASTPLYKYKENVRFLDYGSDTLFTIPPIGERELFAVCPLGSMKREVNTVRYNDQQMEELSSKLLITSMCEDKNFLYITLEWGVSNEYQYILFNKQTGDIRNVGKEGLINDIDGGIPFFPQHIEEDGTMIMWMQAEDFLEKLETIDLNNQQVPNKDKTERLRRLVSKIKVDDNPIFITVK